MNKNNFKPSDFLERRIFSEFLRALQNLHHKSGRRYDTVIAGKRSAVTSCVAHVLWTGLPLLIISARFDTHGCGLSVLFKTPLLIGMQQRQKPFCTPAPVIPSVSTKVCLNTLLWGLVVRVPGYRSRGPGPILGATRFSEKWWVWNGVHSASWVQLRS
jgi:hypothetical protein